MIYIFHGSDSFSRREAIEKLKRELDSDGTLTTNTVVFDARETTPAEVIAACDTVPFFGGPRLGRLAASAGSSSSSGAASASRRQPT